MLKGMLGGIAVGVGLPLFDCLFDNHGVALAQDGVLPVRFGTWFWGCGINPDRWVPNADGAGYDLPVELAMADMGFTEIRYNADAGTVEGVAETFWFGFEDDVVARIGDGRIDFRSVSRVGQSDLGANAKRIMELRKRVSQKLEA